MEMGFYQDEWDTCFIKKNFQWKLVIPGISASGVNSLPPKDSAKPTISFKEIEVPHVTENIFFPGRPDWKPIPLTLYDIQKDVENPVFTWLRLLYDPSPTGCSSYNPSTSTEGCFKPASCYLEHYNGCGEVVERWIYEHPWPNNVEFGTLDMGDSQVATCSLTLRYDRAYIDFPTNQTTLAFDCVLPISCTDIPQSPLISSTGICAEPVISFTPIEMAMSPSFGMDKVRKFSIKHKSIY